MNKWLVLVFVFLALHSGLSKINVHVLRFAWISRAEGFKDFWISIAPVYGKILLTVIIVLFIYTILSKICAKQTIRITKAFDSNSSGQEQQVMLIFLTSAIFLGLVIVSYDFIENLAISYVPIIGGIN